MTRPSPSLPLSTYLPLPSVALFRGTRPFLPPPSLLTYSPPLSPHVPHSSFVLFSWDASTPPSFPAFPPPLPVSSRLPLPTHSSPTRPSSLIPRFFSSFFSAGRVPPPFPPSSLPSSSPHLPVRSPSCSFFFFFFLPALPGRLHVHSHVFPFLEIFFFFLSRCAFEEGG